MMMVLRIGRTIAGQIVGQGRPGAAMNGRRSLAVDDVGSSIDPRVIVMVRWLMVSPSSSDAGHFGIGGCSARVQLSQRREADQPRCVVLGFAEPAHRDLDGSRYGGGSGVATVPAAVTAAATTRGNLSAVLTWAIIQEYVEVRNVNR